jgi:hypothetical protein
MTSKIKFTMRRQNAKLNSQIFVKNNQLYNQSIIKNRQTNYNRLIYRKNHTFGPLFGGPNGDDNDPNRNNPNRMVIMLLASIWLYASSKWR